jgi:hypothetical protein
MYLSFQASSDTVPLFIPDGGEWDEGAGQVEINFLYRQGAPEEQ